MHLNIDKAQHHIGLSTNACSCHGARHQDTPGVSHACNSVSVCTNCNLPVDADASGNTTTTFVTDGLRSQLLDSTWQATQGHIPPTFQRSPHRPQQVSSDCHILTCVSCMPGSTLSYVELLAVVLPPGLCKLERDKSVSKVLL